MGYTLIIMQNTITDLTQMQHDFGQLISMLQEDAGNMAKAVGDLIEHDLQGKMAISLTSMTQNYKTLLQSHAYDRLQQLSLVCKTYQQAIESACATFDNNHPE